MKNLILMSLLLISSHCFAQGGGSGHVGGGGDDFEARVNDIRADLLKWIAAGGARALKLPEGMTYDAYEQAMLSILVPKNVIVSFTDDKVLVDGKEKTCRGEKSATAGFSILCNRTRFKETSESAQYPLIHHEYAGLAGIEKNEGAASDYEISKQITGFLEAQTVLKLVVKPALIKVKEECVLGIVGYTRQSGRRGADPYEMDALSDPSDSVIVDLIRQKGYQVVPAMLGQEEVLKAPLRLTFQRTIHHENYGNGYITVIETVDNFSFRNLSSPYQITGAAIRPIDGKLDPKRDRFQKRLDRANGLNEYEAIRKQIEETKFNDDPGFTALEQVFQRLPSCEQFYKGGR